MSDSHDTAEQLIHMANDIAHFFAADPNREAAILGISNHMKSFWTPKMRRNLIRGMDRGGDEPLEELPKEALRLLAEHPDFKPMQLPEGNPEGGGDAG